jgi:hypothetical protein
MAEQHPSQEPMMATMRSGSPLPVAYRLVMKDGTPVLQGYYSWTAYLPGSKGGQWQASRGGQWQDLETQDWLDADDNIPHSSLP